MPDHERHAVVVGVTGGIACGKSEVGRILESMDFIVCDADRVAHDLMVPGEAVYQRVVGHFGSRILLENGEISRPLLGKIVFEDPEQRQVLNRLVHPAVREFLENWIAQRRARGENAAVQIPLLFESGMETLDWDAIICVSSSESLVFDRLAKRGIEGPEARRRVEAQMPVAEKERLANGVIYNLGTMQELVEATRKSVESLIR